MSIQLPAKVIIGTTSDEAPLGYWPYDDGTGDPWWSFGSSPRDYRWSYTLVIQEQSHSSHLTREPYEYNGYDIKVGDWLANAAKGTAVKITGIITKSSTTLTVEVEDVDRYNTFRNPLSNGAGAIGNSNVVVFTLNEEGEPMFDTLQPGVVTNIFLTNIISRFQNINAEYDFNISKEAHTFNIGDLVSADSVNNTWVKSSSVYNMTIGRVSAMGPGPDNFYITPINRVIDDLDSLPGDMADLLYIDDSNPGGVTIVENNNLIYIKLRNETQTELLGEGSPISTSPGSILTMNDQDMTFAVGNATDVINTINTYTGATGVTAIESAAPTISFTQVPNMVYPFVGAQGNTVAGTINGIPLVFFDTTLGFIEFGFMAANVFDMVNAFTAQVTSVDSNLVAHESNGWIYITHLLGNAITITNTATDSAGKPFGGAASVTGLNLSTAANTNTFVKLSNINASAITLINKLNTPMEDLGLFTVENGAKAAALYVEKGINSAAASTVVADIAGRDALTPTVGDQAMVLDKGNGEWELYLYDGSIWIPIANEDSARTDANSVEYIVNHNTTSLAEIVTVSNNSRITLITIEVVIPFDGTPTLSVGTSAVLDNLFSDDLVDLSSIGTYASQTDTFYNDGIDTDILASYTANGATAGQAKIIVSYM